MNQLVGWQSELELALTVKQRVFLHGNVFDLYMYEERPYTLTGWLVQNLRQRGYELILGYDVVDGEQILYGSEEHRNEIRRAGSPFASDRQRESQIAEQDKGQSSEENRVEDSRERGRQSGGPQNPASATTAGRRQPAPNPAQTEPAVQLQSLRLILENRVHPTALICTHCDKLVAHEKLFSLPERKQSVLVSKLTELTWETESQESQIRNLHNLVILVYDQEGLIPVEFYLRDPAAKVIHIPYPNFETRSRFFDRNWERFYDHKRFPRTSKIEFTESTDSQKKQKPEEIKNYETFARLTEGFTLRELYQLAIYSNEREFSISNFQQLLTYFRSGRRDNPWDAITDSRISQATGILEREVIGQREAVQAVVDMLHRAKAELGRFGPRGAMKPRGVLFFVGPTGVGKTLLARKLAEIIFETEDACTIFDMSEFKEEHTISRLIGSPPGYVGHDTGGQLTNKIRERPFSVLLFDEIEKGHKRILDLFLQILESGRLTDGKGQTVTFSESIIIFTSNIGTKPDRKILRVLKRNLKKNIEPEQLPDLDRDELTAYFTNAVETYFTKGLNRPELFNRLGDNVIVFSYLTEEDCRRISERTITNYFDRIRKKWREKWGSGADLQFDQEKQIVKNIQTLVLKGQNYREYGARGLENMIISKLETPLARLFNEVGDSKVLKSRVEVDHQSGKINITKIAE